MIAAGTQFGRYTIRQHLGQGGMGTVYRAHDTYRGHDVALKLLPAAFVHDPILNKQFAHEIRTIIRLEHHAIVPVYDYGTIHNQPYLAMRLMSGGTLADRLSDRPLTLAEVQPILDRICAALDKAHQNNIVHRDLKPANILFDDEGLAYLADFGVARLTEGTQTTSISGSPHYMAPEQATGSPLDARTDVYQMGAVLFEMLTEQTPYQATTAAAQLYHHVHEPVPSILDANPTLPTYCNWVIQRALAKQPSDRFATAGALAVALGSGGKSSGATILPTPSVTKIKVENTGQTIRRPLFLWAGGIALIIVMLFALVWMRPNDNAAQPTDEVVAAVATESPTATEDRQPVAEILPTDTIPPTEPPIQQPTPVPRVPPVALTVPQDRNNLQIVNHVGGLLKRVVAHGDWLYVSEGAKVTVLDRINLRVVGQSELLPAMIESLVIDGDWLYAGTATGDLFIADIIDLAPIWIAQHQTFGVVRNVYVVDGLAYVAAGNVGKLQVVDVSDPFRPNLVTTFTDLDDVTDVVVQDQNVYVLHNREPSGATVSKLTIGETLLLDTHTPLATERAYDLVRMEDSLYVAAGEAGLIIFDSADFIPRRTYPTEGEYDGTATQIVIQEERLYVAAGYGAVQHLEVGEDGLQMMAQTNVSRPIDSIAVIGDVVYAAEQNFMRALDMRDPDDFIERAIYDPLGSDISVLYVENDRLYVNANYYELRIFDTQTLRQLSINIDSQINEIVRQGDYLFAADLSAGFRVMTAVGAALPNRGTILTTDGQARGIAISSDVAFVADGMEGILSFDISVPSSPREIDRVAPDDVQWWEPVNDVVFLNGYLFSAWRGNGLRVFSVTDGVLSEVGSLELPGGLVDIESAENTLFISANTGGLHIVDVSDPATPTLLSTYVTSGDIAASQLDGDRLIVAARESGVRVIDISDLSNPIEVAHHAIPNGTEMPAWGGTVRVAISDSGDIYAGHFDSGLYVLRDQSASASPTSQFLDVSP